MSRRGITMTSLLLGALLTASCATAASEQTLGRKPSTALTTPTAQAGFGDVVSPTTTAPTTTAPTTTAPTTTAPTTTAAPVPTTVTTLPVATTLPVTTTAPSPVVSPPITSPAPTRFVTEQSWTPFATVGGVTLVHPADRVERVGFHQSNHDGARELDALATAASPVTLESRSRETSARTAADVVVDPTAEIRSPVTGRVTRSGTYVLYCEYSDDYAVIEPDQHPGWEVKLLHIDGVRVGPGERVVAGETVVASRATQLPFVSQVDEVSDVEPAWPHVHIEVIDLAIPDQPSPGGGCS